MFKKYDRLSWQVISIFCLLGLSLNGLSAFASQGQPETLEVGGGAHYNIHDYALIYAEGDSPIALEDAMALPDSQWQRPGGKAIPAGPAQLPFWLKVPVRILPDAVKEWYIVFHDSAGPKAKFYSLSKNGQVFSESIDGFDSFSHRPEPYRLPLIPLSLEAGTEAVWFFRVDNSPTLNMSIELESRREFLIADQRESFLIAMHLGLIIGIMIYHLILFAATRDVSYAIYSLFLFTVLIVSLRMSGFGYQYVWPEFSWMTNDGRTVMFAFTTISSTLFGIHFLQVSQFSKKIANCLYAMCILMTLLLAATYNDTFLSYWVQAPVHILVNVSLLVVGVIAMRHGIVFARYYLMSWLVYFAGMVWFALNLAQVFPYLSGALVVLRTATDAQVILLALALGHRIRELQTGRLLAESENKAKSDFLAKMSHEIRTPMSGVLGMSELLGDRLNDPTNRHYNDVIQNSGRSLLTIINDILDYSKIEAGKMLLETVPFNIEQLAVQSLETFKLKALEKHVELIADVDADLSKVVDGDPTRVKQIMLNLIGNAVKFTEKGQIVLKLERSADNAAQVKISVIDTGPGISQSNQNNLFRAFNQADERISRQFGGTGLGLVISQQLALLMHGNIGVESEIGKGSRFWVTLPLHPHIGEFQINEHHCSDLAGRRILIADDNYTFAELLKTQAEKWHMRATVVHHGQQVLAALESAEVDEQRYDLISLDLFMPIMDGLTTSKKLQEDDRFRDIPRILLTSADSLPSRESLLEAGIQKALEKPSLAGDLHDAFCLALGLSIQVGALDMVAKGVVLETSNKHLDILVVEDNKVNQLVIKGMLLKLDQNVTLVEDGEAAVEFLSGSEHGFDLVLMDCEMPGMDGFSATRRIRKLETDNNLPAVPIVALTAHVLQAQRDACYEAGMDDYLSKPIEAANLVRVIDQVNVSNVGSAKVVLYNRPGNDDMGASTLS